MIPFFLGYALLVWIPTARLRRRFVGFLTLLAGVAGLLAICWAHYQLRHVQPSLYIEGMQALLYPYTAMVAAVGLFIACIPRRLAGHCGSCSYDLTGLPVETICCPECGVPLRPDRCPSCAHGMDESSFRDRACPGCGLNFITLRSDRRRRPSGAERANLRVSDA